MAVTAKTRAKRHAFVSKKGWRAQVPSIQPLDYNLSMMKLLSFFAIEVESKEKREMTIKYWESIGKDCTGYSRIPDGYFNQSGPIAYLIQDEQYVSDKHLMWISDYHSKIKAFLPEEKPESVKPVKIKIDTTNSDANKYAAEIDGAIDDFITSKGKKSLDVKEYLQKLETPAAVSKKIGLMYKGLYSELVEASQDSGSYDITEGYAYLGKRQLSKLTEFVKSIIDSCDVVSTISKTSRKPRARKEKPASVIALKVKYLKEYADLKLKSITPDKIVGANEFWTFNVKLRKMFKYVALPGMTLTWKGTTVQNFDPEKSGAKTLRKPDVFFSESYTKRSINKAFNDIKSVLAKVKGRISEDYIIFDVY
jgi:hypothetical protein